MRICRVEQWQLAARTIQAEIESSNLSPATIAAENKVLKEVKRVFERAAAKDMPVRIATGHWDKDADGTWKYVRDVNTPQVHSSKANPSVKRENLYLTVIKGTRQLPQPKGTPKPHMDMKRQGKVINIKGVGLEGIYPRVESVGREVLDLAALAEEERNTGQRICQSRERAYPIQVKNMPKLHSPRSNKIVRKTSKRKWPKKSMNTIQRFNS